MKNILITGTCLSRNNGQMAMVVSFVENIKKIYEKEECNFTIFSLEPEYDRGRYKPYKIKVLPEVLFYYGKKRMILFYIITIFNSLFYKLFHKSILHDNFTKEVLKSDIVVNLSGDCITYDYHKYPCIVHLLQLYIPTKFYGKFSYIVAQSIGYFDKSFCSKIVLKLLKGINLITCREKRTYDYLENDLDINKNVYLTSDLAYLIKPQKIDNDNTKIVEKLNFTRFINNKYIIALSLSSLIGSFTKDENKITLFYTSLLKDILDINSNISVVLIPHVYQDGHNDIDLSNKIKDALEKTYNDKVFVLQNQYLPTEVKEFIGQCKVMIGFRMHPTIQAISMNIPVISVAYSHKTEGIILDNYGDKFYANIMNVDFSQLNSIILEKLQYIIENEEECINQIKKINEKIFPLSEKNFSLLKEKFI